MISPEIRLINKIVAVGNLTEVKKLKLTKEFFKLAECREAFTFLEDYSKNINTLGYLPTVDIFKRRFPSFTIMDDVPDPVPVLCQELRSELMSRQLEEVLVNVDAIRHTDPYAALSVIQSSASVMMSQHTSNSQLYNLKDSGQMLLERYQNFKNNKGMLGIPWPWPTLNKQTHGIVGGNWIVIYGRPKSGKTTVTIGALASIFKNSQTRMGVFNFEDDEKDLLMLFVCFLCNVDYMLAKEGTLNPADDLRFQETLKEIGAYDGKDGSKLFFVEQCKGADLNYIKSRIEEYALNIAVINGVYFVKDGSSKKTDMDWKVMTNLSRNAKQVARETDCAIIGITQANRDKGEVAYADAFEQDCDTLIKLTPQKFEDGTRGSEFDLQCVRGGGEPEKFYVNSRPGLEITERTGVHIAQQTPQQNSKPFFTSGTKVPIFNSKKQ